MRGVPKIVLVISLSEFNYFAKPKSPNFIFPLCTNMLGNLILNIIN